MNAGLAVRPPYAYVGNRTDPSRGKTHPGVLVVDIGRPASPQVVGEIAPPPPGQLARAPYLAGTGSARRVEHALRGRQPPLLRHGRPSLRFYDIRGDRARSPRLLLEHPTAFEPHEMYLWIDPDGPHGRSSTSRPTRRARMLPGWSSSISPTSGAGGFARSPGGAATVTSVEGSIRSGSRATARALISHISREGSRCSIRRVSPEDMGEGRLHTDAGAALRWSPGPHSAVPVEGTSFVLTTDEVYAGRPPVRGAGCA